VRVQWKEGGCLVEAGEILECRVIDENGEVLGVGETEDEARNAAQITLLHRELQYHSHEGKHSKLI